MNILSNKRILFSLLLSSSLLMQGAYAQENGPSTEISGTLNILPTSSLDTPVLDIPASGSVTVGNENISDGFGVVDINDASNNSHNTKSEIKGTLNIKKDGNFLNEETINCNGIGTSNKANINNQGLFINQGYINVGQFATLTCGTFPTDSDKDAWIPSGTDPINNYQNYGGIMNGYCTFDETNEFTNIKVQTFHYDATNHTIVPDGITEGNADYVSINNRKSKTGTITFIPGAICNDGGTGTPGSGEIDGGTIDLTKYVQIKSSNTTASNTTDPTQNSVSDGDKYSLQFENGANNDKDVSGTPTNDNNTAILKISIKNAEIKLFGDDINIKNSATTQVEMNKRELSALKLETFGTTTGEANKSEKTMQDMFLNLTFENCRCEIPDDVDGGAMSYKASVWYKLNDGKTAYNSKLGSEAQVDIDLNNIRGDNPSATGTGNNQLIAFNSDKRNKIIAGGVGSDSNFDVVKQLFANSNNLDGKKIYHEIGQRDVESGNKYVLWDINGNTHYSNGGTIQQPTDGLILYSASGGQDGTKNTFSKLFNDYMALNCYIDIDNVSNVAGNLDNDLSSSDKKLKLFLQTQIGNAKYDIYMQLSNDSGTNNNVVIQSKTSNLDYSDSSKPDGTLADFSGTLELVMKNPWIHTGTGLPTYKGTLSRTLPTLISTVAAAPSSDLEAGQYVELLENYIAHTASDIPSYDGINTANCLERLEALVKKDLGSISDYEQEKKQQIMNCINKYIKKDNEKKRTTKIVQECAGPAFANYKSKVGVESGTSVNGEDGHEILEYEINCNCGVKTGDTKPSGGNFESSDENKEFSTGTTVNPLVVDKFIVGNNSNVLVRSENSSDNGKNKTCITTQQFQVGSSTSTNTKFELHGHITVKSLKGSDFGIS